MKRLTFILFWLPLVGFAQTNSVSYHIETVLLKAYDQFTETENTDSISFYSRIFREKMNNLIINNPQTMDYGFHRLGEHVNIVTSPDSLFRIYSWDRNTGGTMHFFACIFQFKTKEGVHTYIPEVIYNDPGEYYSKIFQIPMSNKIYYLVIGNGVCSTSLLSQAIQAYTIEGNELVDDAKIFETKTKKLSDIVVEFDFSSVIDNHPERPLELIKYDEDAKNVLIPIVNEKGAVLSKNLIYHLTGDKLKYIGAK